MTLVAVLLAVTVATVLAEDTQAEAVARGKALLGLLDKAEYATAYEAGSAVLRQAVSAEAFASGIKAAAGMVGERKSRKLVKTTHHTALNGMKGDFYVLRFDSSYAKLPRAAELLTVSHEDKQWKLGGYQVLRPDAVPAGF
ncbi:MAG: DUF4019 domain-containing protein [Armatimonadetes bacterium]|nr:DUF4019 domain-containing protein [Armatimonadota bacterium]